MRPRIEFHQTFIVDLEKATSRWPSHFRVSSATLWLDGAHLESNLEADEGVSILI